MIGSSDGQQYADQFEHAIAQHQASKAIGPKQNPDIGMQLEGEETNRRDMLDPVDPKGSFLDEPTQGQKYRDLYGPPLGRVVPEGEEDSKGAIHPDKFLEDMGIDMKKSDMGFASGDVQGDRGMSRDPTSPWGPEQQRQWAPESIRKDIGFKPPTETPNEKLEETHGIRHPEITPLSPLKSGTNPNVLKLPTGNNPAAIAKKIDPSELIVAPAVRNNQGEIFKGKENHTEAFQAAVAAGQKRGDLDTNTFGGFVTNTGKYLDRKEALDLATLNGQLIKGSESRGPLENMLMSHQVDWDKAARHSRLLEKFAPLSH